MTKEVDPPNRHPLGSACPSQKRSTSSRCKHGTSQGLPPRRRGGSGHTSASNASGGNGTIISIVFRRRLLTLEFDLAPPERLPIYKPEIYSYCQENERSQREGDVESTLGSGPPGPNHAGPLAFLCKKREGVSSAGNPACDPVRRDTLIADAIQIPVRSDVEVTL